MTENFEMPTLVFVFFFIFKQITGNNGLVMLKMPFTVHESCDNLRFKGKKNTSLLLFIRRNHMNNIAMLYLFINNGAWLGKKNSSLLLFIWRNHMNNIAMLYLFITNGTWLHYSCEQERHSLLF